MARLGFGRGGEDRLRELLTLLEPGRQRPPPTVPPPCTPTTPSRTGSRGRCTRSGPAGSRTSIARPATSDRPSRGSRSGRRTRDGSARVAAVCSNQNVDSPVRTRPLSGIRRAGRRRTPRSGRRDDQDPVVVDVVEVADLAGVAVGQSGRVTGRGSSPVDRPPRVRARGPGRSTRRAGPRRAPPTRRPPLPGRRGTVAARPTSARGACAIRYASSRVSPPRRSASRTGWLKTRPCEDRASPACGRRGRPCRRRSTEPHGDVVREVQRVGENDALDRRMRDVTLVPERDVLESRPAGWRAGRVRAAQAARSSPGCACAASRSSPSGPVRNGSSTSPTSVRCRWRILVANASIRRAQRCDVLRTAPRAGHARRSGCSGLRRKAQASQTNSPRSRGRRSSRCRRRPQAFRRRSSRAPGPGALLPARGLCIVPTARGRLRTSRAPRGSRGSVRIIGVARCPCATSSHAHRRRVEPLHDRQQEVAGPHEGDGERPCRRRRSTSARCSQRAGSPPGGSRSPCDTR